jgi:RNA polymerase sigma factor (sigma-70 family)
MKQETASSLEEAHELYFDRVVAFVYKFCKNKNIAEDCAQEAFKVLSRKKVMELENVLSWLFLCSKHRYFKFKKKQDRYTFLEDYSSYEEELKTNESPESILTESESFDLKSKMITNLLEKLSEKQRKAIQLRYYKNLSYEEIAKKMNTNVNNVGFSICTGIKNLRKHFFKHKTNQEILAN